MKEIYKATERAFLSIPEGFRDWATVRFAEYFLQSGFGHGFKTGRGIWWGRKIMDAWLTGKKAPFSEYTQGILDGYSLKFRNFEILTQNGPEIIVINEPNTGLLRGNWVRFALNLAIAERRARLGNYEARWVQKSTSNSFLGENTPFKIQKRRLAKMLNTSCNTILVELDGNLIRAGKAVLEMVKHLKTGGVLVICPEGNHDKTLQNGRPEAGELLGFLVKKTGVDVRPVGAWDDGCQLNLGFGPPIEVDGAGCKSGQDLADLAMIKIASLLPKDRRGVYQKIVKNIENNIFTF